MLRIKKNRVWNDLGNRKLRIKQKFGRNPKSDHDLKDRKKIESPNIKGR